jgi:hypothetical protein
MAMATNLASALEHFGDVRPDHCWQIAYSFYWSIIPHLLNALQWNLASAFAFALVAMVMWVVVIGRWHWCLCWHKSYIQVGIVIIYIISNLFFLV